MNSKKIVSFSNTLGLVSILLLVYWVFTFIIMQVFGLKVFQKNITQTFNFSILGILSLMFGALIINIMFNLSRIAQKHNADDLQDKKNNKYSVILLIISFPLIVALLFIGDSITSTKKEKMLINSAVSIIETNRSKIDIFANYDFSKEWLSDTNNQLKLFSKIDKNYSNVSIIVSDTVDGVPLFLIFGNNYYSDLSNRKELNKIDFVFETDLIQRNYLNSVLLKDNEKKYFHSENGNYELFYPIVKNGKKIILYFQDKQRYGSLSS